jgi:hypothetical protein
MAVVIGVGETESLGMQLAPDFEVNYRYMWTIGGIIIGK